MRVLAAADKAFTGREVHRRAGVASVEGIRLALGRLVEQGIVEAERAGRAVLYRLNRDHLGAPYVVALAALRLELGTRLRATVTAWPTPAAAVAMFGSAARGEADSGSDIDLLVVRPEDVHADDSQWRDQIVALERATSRWTGNDTRTLEYSARDFVALRYREPALVEATRDGIVLAGAFPPDR
jgi:hypothetical protein